MSRFVVIATTRSPLAISVSKAAGNDLDTARVIPGTAVRGALANLFLGRDPAQREARAKQPAFREMFLSGAVRFGNLRLNGHDVWPLSARSCKAEKERHPVGDVLLATAVERLARIAGAESVCSVKPECGVAGCEAKREAPPGFREETERGFKFPEVKTRRVAHVEIDIETDTSRSGNFHSSRVIGAGQRFDGTVFSTSTSGSQALRNLVGVGKVLHFGRGRSRGQGEVALTMIEAAPDAPGMVERVEGFNREVAKTFPELSEYVLFSCLLRSATVVYDRWLMSRSSLEADDLGKGFGGYKPLMWCSRMATVSGWHAAAGLPKPDTAAITPGSCWLFGKPVEKRKRQAEMQRMGPLLAEAEERGIGERPAEGFGEVVFCDAFHWKHAIREAPEE